MNTNLLDTPTITFRTFETLHGARIGDVPLVLFERDDLQSTQRLDDRLPFHTDLDGWAIPENLSTFMGQWRPCVVGQPVDVEVTSSVAGACLYVETSADGAAVTDSVSPSAVQEDERECLRFTPSLPFYRVGIAPPLRCRVRLLSQQQSS